MTNSLGDERTAHLVDARDAETLDVLGPTIQLLTSPEDESAPCVMRGTIPPDVSVPLHSHPDPETLLLVSGEVEGLAESADGFR
jgi:quercetin dioxygenase-like cupin family protein